MDRELDMVKEEVLEALPAYPEVQALLNYLLRLPPQALQVTFANLRVAVPNRSNEDLYCTAVALARLPAPLIKERYQLFWPDPENPRDLSIGQARHIFETDSWVSDDGAVLHNAQRYISPYFTPTRRLSRLLAARGSDE